MTDPLDPLFAPAGVAVIGASDDPSRIGGRPLRYLREGGYRGAVFAVNPRRETVQGARAWASVSDLPSVPDAAILALPAAATPGALEACADKGVGAAVVFSAGFAETGAEGAALQARLAAIAREAGMRLLGPNCLGVFNPAIGWYGTFSVVLDGGALFRPGPVGIVSQSGAYGAHIAHLARGRGLGIGAWITTGNEADVDVAEALAWMAGREDLSVIMAYAEGVKDRDAFLAALETARARGKAVVFMKTGASAVGADAAASHTASLAGSDAVFDAALRQHGAWRAASTAEQIDIAVACAAGRYPEGRRLGIFTMSGGFGIQLADHAEAEGLDVAPMPEAAQREMLDLLPFAAPRNPVDATAQAANDLGLMEAGLRLMATRGGYDMTAAILGAGPAAPSFAEPLRRTLAAALAEAPDALRGLTMTAPEDVVRAYEAAGFLVYEDGAQLARAFAALAAFGEGFGRAAEAAPPPMAPAALPEGPLSEAAAKRILGAAGIPFPPETLVSTPAEAAAEAARIGGPAALKICSPDIAHKTEIGGVALDLPNPEAVERAAARILAAAAEKAPDARVEGLLIAPMAPRGVECIIGAAQDPALGPVVMFGLGGVFVEVLKDVAFRTAPFGPAEARRMIEEIRGFPLLQGARGGAPADIDALARALSALSRFAHANRDRVASVELNPVRALPEGRGIAALDALIQLSPRPAAARTAPAPAPAPAEETAP